MTGRVVQRVVLLASVALWGVSLALPAIDVAGGPTLSGWDVLTRGFSAWRQGVFAWFANPLLAAAAAASVARRDGSATLLAGAAVLLGLTSLWAAQMARASGATVPSFTYLAGFYVWIAAEAGTFAAALGGLALHRNAAQS